MLFRSFNGLTVNSTGNIVVSQLGDDNPIYIMQTSPSIGFNLFFDAGWKYGQGSVSEYGGTFGFIPSLGEFSFSTSSLAGNAGDIAGLNTLMILKQSGEFLLPLTPSKMGIGTGSVDASSILHLQSTTKGFLPPRPTQAQKLAIASPATGLIVYDTTNSTLEAYNGTDFRDLSNNGKAVQINTVTIQNTTTETSVFGFLQGSNSIPGNSIKSGTTYRLSVSGTFSSLNNDSIAYRLRYGGIAGVIVLSDTILFTSLTSETFSLSIDLTFRQTNVSQATGRFIWEDTLADTIEMTTKNTVGLSTLLNADLQLTFQWSIASASNSVQITTVILEKIF